MDVYFLFYHIIRVYAHMNVFMICVIIYHIIRLRNFLPRSYALMILIMWTCVRREFSKTKFLQTPISIYACNGGICHLTPFSDS